MALGVVVFEGVEVQVVWGLGCLGFSYLVCFVLSFLGASGPYRVLFCKGARGVRLRAPEAQSLALGPGSPPLKLIKEQWKSS